MEADLREDAIRLAEAAKVRGERSSHEVVLYDADGKPHTYVTPTMVKPMTYEGSARYHRAMLLGGNPEPKRDSQTGLRCVQLSSADVGLSWLREDINRLAAGALRSDGALTPADPEAERQEVEDRLADLITQDPGWTHRNGTP